MGLAIGILFAAVGAIALILSLCDLVDVFASRDWQTVQGFVEVSDLQRSRDSDGVMYRAEIVYRYIVNGEEFVASRARFGDRLSVGWSGPAVRLTRKYPPGREVTVHYDPEAPREAVLEPGMSGLVWAGIVFGLIFVLFGLLSIRSGT